MKADIHPDNYRPVVFQDFNDGTCFLVRSTVKTKETIKHEDGQTYPLVKLQITSASHPFYTGQEKIIDTEGRIDKFEKRRQAAEAARARLQAKSKSAAPKQKAPEKSKSVPADTAKSPEKA